MKEIRGIQVLETIEEIVNPKHTALLIIDVQNDTSSPKGFIASQGKDISWVRDVLPRIKTVIVQARQLGLLIIFVRVTSSKSGAYESGPRMRLLGKNILPVHAVEYKLEGTWGNEVSDELEPSENEPQIIKYRSSAFLGTPLDIVLKNKGIKTVVLTGLATEGCVETSARDAEQHGYYVVVLQDCVCSPRPDLHKTSLSLMSYRYEVTSSIELLRLWHSA